MYVTAGGGGLNTALEKKPEGAGFCYFKPTLIMRNRRNVMDMFLRKKN